jgi:GTP-binding protein
MSKFVDEVDITVSSGKGGAGAVSFRREKYVPKGGPDGGDGGKGGDVILRVREDLRTLYHLKANRTMKAKNGLPGRDRNRHGADGADAVVHVPRGTVVLDSETNRTLADLTEKGDWYMAAQGGRGGQGNARFATSTNQAPRFAQPGETGVEVTLTLHIKVIADIGLVGLPNAGKSTLLSVISNARPKIAGYPFTTLTPNLGVMQYHDRSEYVIADIPGLIEGASTGHGLGIRFLKHIERTKILLLLLDLFEQHYEEDFRTLVSELQSHSQALLDKPRLVVGTKLDAVDAQRAASFLASSIDGEKLVISSATGKGIDELKDAVVSMMEESRE